MKIAASILALIAATVPIRAANILSHSGSTNPTTEGWTLLTSGIGSPSTTLSGINDGGTSAWAISNPAGTQQGRYYSGAIDPVIMANAKTTGYEISFEVSGISNLSSDAQSISLSDGTDFWAVYFTGDLTGTTTRLYGSWSGFIAIDNYATVTLRYDAGDTVMDLFIDGVEQVQNLSSSSFTTSSPRLEWGFAFPPNVAANEGRYALVEMSSIPEPSTTALLIGGIVLVAARRRRKF